MSERAARELVLGALADALATMDPRRLVREALGRPPRLPACVVAIGKASAAMARGAYDAWEGRIERALVVAPEGTDAPAIPRATIVRAAHPIPDRASVRAAELCFEAVRPRAHVLVLVSGGASSLVCAPSVGVTLADKREVTRVMLASGATIQEVNVVRKHLSRIKGGGLLRAAGANPVTTLVLSDVVGGRASDVGSGPSVPDRSSVAEARALLRRYAPAFAGLPLTRSFAKRSTRARLVGSPERFAEAFAASLGARGVRVRLVRPSQAPAETLAREYLALARGLRRGRGVVRAAEPSIVVPRGAKRGGRATHVAALVASDLPEGIVFAALATDGVDGASRTSGAIVEARVEGAAEAAAAFDTGRLLSRAGAAVPERPSGSNFADVHVLLRL